MSNSCIQWLSLESAAEIRLHPYVEKLTVGSERIAKVQLSGKKLHALHAQFLTVQNKPGFRDLSSTRWLPLSSEEPEWLGEWAVRIHRESEIQRRFGFLIRQSFQSWVKQNPSGSLEEAIQATAHQWCFGNALPESVQVTLKAEYQEWRLSGPIETLLQDEFVTDILVEGHDKIWVERSGVLERSKCYFQTSASYEIYLENLLTHIHKSIHEAQPFIDFNLPDGSRGHLIGPPVTNGKGYHLSIRRIRKQAFDLKDLENFQMISEKQKRVLTSWILERRNFLISGATGSGKTTLIRALLKIIPSDQRILVIEDTPELYLERQNSIFLQTRVEERADLPPITLRHLVRQALRMRPDRIMIGEVRGEEALDLIHAMNTGHRGCLGSLHANSTEDALYRLQGLVQMSSTSLSESVTRDLIARNIHGVIQCGRNSNGSRRILEISELSGLNAQEKFLLRSVG